VDLVEIVARLRETGAELEDIEVKRAGGGLPQSLVETMSAFANARGGIIVLGLDEQAGFTPIDLGNALALRDELAGVARGRLTPALTPSVEIVPFEGAALVVAEVEPLPPAQRPCYVTSSGLYNGAFIRVGEGDQRLTPYEIDRLKENSGQPRWDEEPVPRATAADLDRGAVLRLIEAASRSSPRSFAGLNDSEALTRLGVLVPSGGTLVPSLAGLLAVGTYPQQFFPQLMVTVAVYPHEKAGEPGPGGLRFLDSAPISGPVPTMVIDTIQAVQRNLRRSSLVVGGGREDVWEIGAEVIREAVVNAIMHRDYSPQARGTQIQVELFPDRLTITSPGGLFGNVRLETLGETGTSSSRNARLAALLQETGEPRTGRPVAENRGSGISLMISQVRHDTGLVPFFGNTLDYFRVTVPRSSPVTPQLRAWATALVGGSPSEAQISALVLARGGQEIDVALLRRLGLEPSDARRQLRHLRQLGLLRPRKAREDGTYVLAPSLADAAAPPPENDSIAGRVLTVLDTVSSASRDELQAATGGSRSGVTKALDALLAAGMIEATAPKRSPKRRYRRSQPPG